MAKLRHIALSVPDPEKAAAFYCEAFDMQRVGTTDSPLATGVYVSDGVVTMALLKYKTDAWAGYVKDEDERGKDYVGIHHLGFWVDDEAKTLTFLDNTPLIVTRLDQSWIQANRDGVFYELDRRSGSLSYASSTMKDGVATTIVGSGRCEAPPAQVR